MSSRRIKPRTDIIQQFTTFLDTIFLDAKKNSSDNDAKKNNSDKIDEQWKQIPRLKKNMQRLAESNPDAKTAFFLKYFWQEACFSNPSLNKDAKEHLSAYLEEACYWATNEIYKQLRSQNMNWLDCFQIARDAALTPQIFSKYNDSRGMSLKTYLQDQIEKHLKEVLRKGQEAASYSDWGLLRHTPIKKSLKQAGITEPQLSRCALAWRCFKEIYTPTKVRQQLQPPKPEELTAIAELYNQLRLPQEPALSGNDIKILLEICIKAARASTKIPQSVSCDHPKYLEEDLDHPNHEHLRPPTPEIHLEQAEQEEQRQQMKAVLAKAIADLPQSAQTMLQLWHGLGLTQSNIGKVMSLPQYKQYKVSRQLNDYKKPLLKALTEWSQTQTEIRLSLNQVNELQGALNEWLNSHCRSLFDTYLQTTLLKELKDEIPLLKRYYGQTLSQVEVANQLNLSETEVNQRLEQVEKHLQSRLYNWLKDTYNLSPDALNSAVKPIADLVEEWLKTAKYSIFEI